LSTRTVKATVPPGSGRLVGSGVFSTVMLGCTSVMVTVALSLSLAVLPPSSCACAVTVLICGPGSPFTSAEKVHS